MQNGVSAGGSQTVGRARKSYVRQEGRDSLGESDRDDDDDAIRVSLFAEALKR